MGIFGPPNIEKLKAKRKTKALIKALQYPNVEVRTAAAEALGQVNNSQAIESIIDLIGKNADDPEILNIYAIALGNIGAHAADPLIKFIENGIKDNNIRDAVATAIAKIGTPSIESLINSLDTFEPDKTIYMAIEKIGYPAVEHIINAAKNGKICKINLIEAFEYIGAPALDPLIIALSDKDANIREVAAGGLGIFKDKSTIDPLNKLLSDKDENVRAAAVSALCWVPYNQVDKQFITALKDRSGKVRKAALGKFAYDFSDLEEKRSDSRAKDLLIKAIEDPDENVCDLAIKSTLLIQDKRAIEPLINALKHEKIRIRSSAAHALISIGDERAVNPLIEVLEDNRPGELTKAMDSHISKLTSKIAFKEGSMSLAKEVISKFYGDLRDFDGKDILRGYAAKALGKIKDTRALKPLVEALNEKNEELRITIVESLEEILETVGDTDTLEPIMKTLRSHDKDNRLLAIHILKKIVEEIENDKSVEEYSDQTLPKHEIVQQSDDLMENVSGVVLTSIRGLVLRGDLSGVKRAIEMGEPVDSVDLQGSSTLFIAAQEGHSDIIEYLLNQGADSNLSNENDIPPLNQASYFGHLKAVKQLIKAGADVGASDDQGLTALHNAAAKGHLLVVQHLMDSGADPTAINISGKQPIDFASERSHDDVVAYLQTVSKPA
jgi:HEAT repeat protein